MWIHFLPGLVYPGTDVVNHANAALRSRLARRAGQRKRALPNLDHSDTAAVASAAWLAACVTIVHKENECPQNGTHSS